MSLQSNQEKKDLKQQNLQAPLALTSGSCCFTLVSLCTLVSASVNSFVMNVLSVSKRRMPWGSKMCTSIWQRRSQHQHLRGNVAVPKNHCPGPSPALSGAAHLEVLNKLLRLDLEQQLKLPQLPLQQLLVHQLKSDFAGGCNADGHMKLLQFSACDSGSREEEKRFTSCGQVCSWWPKFIECAK